MSMINSFSPQDLFHTTLQSFNKSIICVKDVKSRRQGQIIAMMLQVCRESKRTCRTCKAHVEFMHAWSHTPL